MNSCLCFMSLAAPSPKCHWKLSIYSKCGCFGSSVQWQDGRPRVQCLWYQWFQYLLGFCMVIHFLRSGLLLQKLRVSTHDIPNFWCMYQVLGGISDQVSWFLLQTAAPCDRQPLLKTFVSPGDDSARPCGRKSPLRCAECKGRPRCLHAAPVSNCERHKLYLYYKDRCWHWSIIKSL